MKQHLKRIASPRTWFINRKENCFIIRPKSGGHPFELGLPLGVIIRDRLGLAATLAEAKKLLCHKQVMVDGKRRKDPHYLIGLFDVLELPDLKKAYRLIIDSRGRLSLVSVPENEKKSKPCKIIGKKILPKGRLQFNLHDGKNILLNRKAGAAAETTAESKAETKAEAKAETQIEAIAKARVGDTLLLTLPGAEVSKVLPLQPGMAVFLTRGKHSGEWGELKELRGNEAVYRVGKEETNTAKNYLFVIGGQDKRPVISLEENEKPEKEKAQERAPEKEKEKEKEKKAEKEEVKAEEKTERRRRSKA